jgi:hypothetical protein
MKKLLAIAIAIASAPWMMSAHAAPLKVPVPGKVTGFAIYSMEFSGNGEQLCIAGTDADDAGGSTGRMLLIDRVRGAVLWQQAFAAPDGHAAVYPVQCRVAVGGVYLLADVATSTSSEDARTITYMYRFDTQTGKPAWQALKLAARASRGYAVDIAADGTVKLSGYLKDRDAQSESYATYSATLNAALQIQGEPVIRKSGAYVNLVAARIVGDSTYLTGMFAPARLAKDAPIDDFAASRLRLNGTYAWSSHPHFGAGSGVLTAVGDDGTTYAVRYTDATTTLLTTPPGGKPLPQRSYTSNYCETESMAAYGRGLIAVRHVCAAGGAGALLSLDPVSGKEIALDWVRDEPWHVATSGAQWAVLAKGKDGQLAVHFGEQAAGGASSAFTLQKDGVEHTLQLSARKVDGKGVPSFDYVYEQHAGACRFSLTGHAVAGFQEKGGKVELDVFNPEDAQGRELPQILAFYDNAVTMTLPLKGALRQVTFNDQLNAEQQRASCGKKEAKLSLLFRQ